MTDLHPGSNPGLITVHKPLSHKFQIESVSNIPFVWNLRLSGLCTCIPVGFSLFFQPVFHEYPNGYLRPGQLRPLLPIMLILKLCGQHCTCYGQIF